jgi:DNA-binding CsgD family transcriptional regulator
MINITSNNFDTVDLNEIVITGAFKDDTISPLDNSIKLDKPQVIYFTRDHGVDVEFLTQVNFCEFLFCHDWSSLSSLLKYRPKYLIVDHKTIADGGNTLDEFVLMLETMLKYLDYDHDIKVGVIIDKTATMALIKKLQRSALIQGIVPNANDFGSEQAQAALNSIVTGVQYWPQHVIDQFSPKKKIQNSDTITLTPRQQEILELITERGISNKQIARILKISESTVKIHVSAIMRAYCVRNRTQLALTGKSLTKH